MIFLLTDRCCWYSHPATKRTDGIGCGQQRTTNWLANSEIHLQGPVKNRNGGGARRYRAFYGYRDKQLAAD